MTAILVIGGYGGFGASLSRRLAAGGHQVLVGGRSQERAARFCADTPGCRPARVDRGGDLAETFDRHRSALVIDAAGPFQGSGYAVAEACIAAGIPYLDLADASDFVCDIGRLDGAARAAGVVVVSGASSVPALSGAVAHALAAGMERIDAVEMAISASNRAAAGPSVAAAILSYVGRPIPLWRHRRIKTGHGWQNMRRERFEAGDGQIMRRWAGLADVPDLVLLPERLPGRPSVTFRAGTELGFQNLTLWLASWPVRWGWVQSLRPLAGFLLPAQRLTRRLGGVRSGMTVRLFGRANGQRLERRWTLIADDGCGPEIPVLAAAILAERILKGRIAPGARDAGRELTLADFEPAFAAMPVRHSISEYAAPPPLYARVMGDNFARLAPAVAAMHDVLRQDGAIGRATVTGGRGVIARLIARLMCFPPSGDYPLHVAFDERNGVERWTRDFGGHRFRSELSARMGQAQERFGPLRFRFDLPVANGGLRMIMRGWSAFGLPMPLALAPRSEASEWEEDGRFHFDVPIALPLVGRIVHYRGWLERRDAPASPHRHAASGSSVLAATDASTRPPSTSSSGAASVAGLRVGKTTRLSSTTAPSAK